MSDYFEALALRTLRPEVGVQPRHRVTFEEEAAVLRDTPAPRPVWSPVAEGPAHPQASPEPRRTTEPRPSAEPDVTTESGRRPPLNASPVSRRPRRATEIVPPERVASDPHRTLRAPRPSSGQPAGVGTPASEQPHAIQAWSQAGRSQTVTASRAHEAPSLAHAGPAPQLPAEPTIRIHIGRVDVRAVTTAPASRPASRETGRALMTLEEYTRQRRGDRS